MAPSPLQLIFLALPLVHIPFSTSLDTDQVPQPYVVYMGSSGSWNNPDKENSSTLEFDDHYFNILSSVNVPDGRRFPLHHYNYALSGFSALLTPEEASILSGHDQVVSVFPDPTLHLHTTRSWDFLGAQQYHPRHPTASDDVIIGIIDSGIWPESPSFKDDSIGKVPKRWRGVCMEGADFKCNRKIIGARYYNIGPATALGSPRDSDGHGTHTASTAAGAKVANASYFGLAKGTARGGYPSSRIAVYKACSGGTCAGSTILKAIDDATRDGVDIISISIGINSIFQSDFLEDPIAIGAFHAQQQGVMVVCSAGNDGPATFTVVNSAPWIFTVAASTIDRDMQSTLLLGNGRVFKGSAINISNLTRSSTYPLAYGKDVANKFTPTSEARSCYPGSLDPKKVQGKIIACFGDLGVSRRIQKLVAEDARAKGVILVRESRDNPFDSGAFPFTEVGSAVGYKILKYINSNKRPTATIFPTVGIDKYRPAPVVASFSSRGPSSLTENILKPDIMAPGVAILAAIVPKAEEGSSPTIGSDSEPAGYAMRSGTSMACPHVAGAAAFVKSVHPMWSFSAIKSALMTTATWRDNSRRSLRNSSWQSASPHETGVGELSPVRALNPGLVFETTPTDYLKFLCFYGYSNKTMRSMSGTNFRCPPNKTSDSEALISSINYPSISISNLDRVRTIKRKATNAGFPNATYTASVHAPSGLVVKVSPQRMGFTDSRTAATFTVSFDGKEASTGYNYGDITWSDGQHSVRMVFAVNVQ